MQGATQGTVFEDHDADGRRDDGEPGIAGVVVSNQEHFARTDANGAYRLDAGGFGAVFVSLPRGFRATGPWWRRADPGGATDFALATAAEPRTIAFVHASDTHIQNSSAVRTVRLRALVDSIAPRFTIVTGDLVRDALRVGEAEAAGYCELFARKAAELTSAVHTVPGNHEVFGVERERSGVARSHPLYGRAMYRKFRGPDYYSFDAGGVHFVALNTVDVDDQWYHGDVDGLQLAWLARDLAEIPAGMPVVTFNHIPFHSEGEQLDGYDDGPPAPTLITVNGRTQFHQGSATVSSTPAGPFVFPSGVTVYRVTDGRVDDGTFIPLEAAPRDAP